MKDTAEKAKATTQPDKKDSADGAALAPPSYGIDAIDSGLVIQPKYAVTAANPPSVQGVIQRHALEEIASTDSNIKPRQDLDTNGQLNPVYAQAWEVAWSEFKPKVQSIAHYLKAEAEVAPLKGRERAKEKAHTDYKDDTSGLVDIARASIVCKTADDVLKAWEMVNKEFKLVRVKNRFAKPVGGYRDLMMNVELSNGHIAELQIHLKAISDVKGGGGHDFYNIVRKLEPKEKDGELTDKEAVDLAKARKEMEKLYTDAWEKAIAIPEK